MTVDRGACRNARVSSGLTPTAPGHDVIHHRCLSKSRLAGDFGRFVAFEYEAAVIKSWQVLRIPALLQTRRYALDAAALSARRHPDDPGVHADVDLVMDRQQALLSRLEGPHPPRITAMIDDSVLRRVVGGHDTMRDQLDQLLTVAANDAYTIGVVPSDAVQHPDLGGAFTLLEFDGVSSGLFVQAAAGVDALITDDMVTAKYRDIMEDLRRISVVGDAALRTIRAVRAGHGEFPTLSGLVQRRAALEPLLHHSLRSLLVRTTSWMTSR